MTQRKIASAVGISRSYVSRIEKKALDKLKKVFANKVVLATMNVLYLGDGGCRRLMFGFG